MCGGGGGGGVRVRGKGWRVIAREERVSGERGCWGPIDRDARVVSWIGIDR